MRNYLLILVLSISIMWSSIALAAKPEGFEVTIDPPTFKVNQTVDVTIRAVDADGDTVKDYTNMVIIEFAEYLDPDIYDVPSDSIYTFTIDDQGSKKFSQALRVREAGTFTLRVFDIADETIQGSQVIIVGEGELDNTPTDGIATVISPLSGEIITTQSINILGRAEFVKSPVQIFLNGLQNEIEAETDENGNFNVFLTSVMSGTNELFVRIVNINNEILAESEPITFMYEPPISDGIFQGLTISPSNRFDVGDKIKYTVTAGEGVRDVELRVGSLGIFPLDNEAEGIYSKEITIDKIGDHDIAATLINTNGERNMYPNIGKITVLEKAADIRIQNLRVVRDSLETTQIRLSWNTVGEPYGYEIRYGSSKDNLDQQLSTRNRDLIVNDLQPGQDYFFQVFGVNENNGVLGFGSEIVGSQFLGSAPQEGSNPGNGTCSVGGINISTTRIGNQYYLTRSPIATATNYIIHRGNANGTNMQKVGETTETRFPYPFNPNAETDEFATYKVEATCADGNVLQIDGVKSVQVGPISNTIVILCITGLVYFGRRLRDYKI